MKILITGGSGFLGFHLIKRFLKDKHQLTILDRDDLPETKLLTKLKFLKGDVRDSNLIKSACQNQDLIIHAAASLPLESPDQITTTTINGTQNIIDSSDPKTKIIYISSTAVYGVPTKHPILETDPLVGVGPYGIAKIEAEKICIKHRSSSRFIAIIRPKTFIGTERLGVFQILFNWVRLGKKIPIIGNGHNKYQLLDVEDLVSAITILGQTNQKSANDTFNIGAENFQTVYQDVKDLCDHAGNGSIPLPIPSFVVKQPLRILEAMHLSPLYKWVYETADKDSFVSIDKLKQLGWTPTRSNAEALINSYDWYIQNFTEIEKKTGTRHRVSWDQGALKFIKKFM